jgi:iron complex transport system permease protein
LLWGGDYRRLIPLSIIAGAAFLLLADILARTIIAPQEVPLGVITAMFGAPFFLWLLRRTKKQTSW